MKQPIANLVDELVACFRRDERGPDAARALGGYAREHEDWRRFARFDPSIYTRNLVLVRRHQGTLAEDPV